METSTGQVAENVSSETHVKVSLIDQLNAIKDKNSSEYRSKVREFETSLGIKEVNAFGTANRKIFEENLDNMSFAQIQDFARKLSVDTAGQKTAIKIRLLKAFDTQNVQSRGYFSPQPQNKELFSKEQKEALQKILNG